MPSTRRRFVGSCGAVLLGLAGCTQLEEAASLRAIQLDLLNQTGAPLTFHFALEANDGLGRWHDFALDPDGRRQVVVEPATDREWSGYHAVVGDKRASGSLLGQGDGRSCLQLNYRINEGEMVATLSTNQPLCRG